MIPGLDRMREWAFETPAQIRAALAQADAEAWPPDPGGCTSVVLAGMGGSAIACDLARSLLLRAAPVPVSVHRDPQPPGWAGPDAWTGIVSYSGDTWESRAVLAACRARHGRGFAIASGGGLAGSALRDGLPFFRVPGGYAPRAAFGWMFAPVALACARAVGGAAALGALRAGLDEALSEMEAESALWRAGGALPGRDPRALAAAIAGRLTLAYAPSEAFRPAAVRWKSQIQENGKQAALEAAFPEVLHNEIMGWEFVSRGPGLPAVFLLLEAGDGISGPEEAMERAALDAADAELRAAGARVLRVPARGRGAAALLSHVFLADMTSIELAAARGIDPLPVAPIERVKAVLRDRRKEFSG